MYEIGLHKLIPIFQYPAKKKITWEKRKERKKEASTSIDGAFQSSSICTSNAKNTSFQVVLNWNGKEIFLVINEKSKQKNKIK